MGWFSRKTTPANDRQLGPRGPVLPAGYEAGHQKSALGGVGPYKSVWERKRLPDEGAQSYAWETLGLVQFTQIGAGVSVRDPDFDAVLHRPLYVYQGGITNGLPMTAGGIYGQPLYDNNGNVVDAPGNPGVSPMIAWNIPVSIMPEGGLNSIGINNPFPQHMTGR